jgi:hypothetical protein
VALKHVLSFIDKKYRSFVYAGAFTGYVPGVLQLAWLVYIGLLRITGTMSAVSYLLPTYVYCPEFSTFMFGHYEPNSYALYTANKTLLALKTTSMNENRVSIEKCITEDLSEFLDDRLAFGEISTAYAAS